MQNNTDNLSRFELTSTSSAANQPTDSRSIKIGARIKLFRTDYGWTLDKLCEASGVSRSALSKIENGQVSPTFEVILKVANGLGVDIVDLIGVTRPNAPSGRRSISRNGDAPTHQTDQYTMEVYAADLAQKSIQPFRVTIKARSFEEFADWDRHETEDFVYVLENKVIFYSEWYGPTTLDPGDSIYIDSRMGHAFVSASKELATILWISAK